MSNNRKVFFEDKTFTVFRGVYEPAEDTFLIAKNLEVNIDDDVLDVGSGCGILSILTAQKARRVVAVDISPDAVRCTKFNTNENGVSNKVDVVRGDLIEPLRKEALFDIIIFNSPYLPTDDEKPNGWIDYAWLGGREGRETINRFIEQTPKHLKARGRILLVQSTLSDVKKTMKSFAEKGLKVTVVAEQKIAFETITVIQARKAS